MRYGSLSVKIKQTLEHNARSTTVQYCRAVPYPVPLYALRQIDWLTAFIRSVSARCDTVVRRAFRAIILIHCTVPLHVRYERV